MTSLYFSKTGLGWRLVDPKLGSFEPDWSLIVADHGRGQQTDSYVLSSELQRLGSSWGLKQNAREFCGLGKAQKKPTMRGLDGWAVSR